MLTTVFAVIGCTVAVVLLGFVCWLRRQYAREIQSRDETIESKRYHLQRLQEVYACEQKAVAERDETIDGLIARIEEHEQTIADGKKIIAELRQQSIRSTERIQFLTFRNGELDRILNALRKDFHELELTVETRGGQVPDLNTAWHMTDKPVAVKQKYLLDDTPLDDSGSGVIDSKPYAE